MSDVAAELRARAERARAVVRACKSDPYYLGRTEALDEAASLVEALRSPDSGAQVEAEDLAALREVVAHPTWVNTRPQSAALARILAALEREDEARVECERLRRERDELAEKSTALIEGLAKQFPQVRDLCEQMGFDPAPTTLKGEDDD
jgi:hypothetical protein